MKKAIKKIVVWNIILISLYAFSMILALNFDHSNVENYFDSLLTLAYKITILQYFILPLLATIIIISSFRIVYLLKLNDHDEK